MTGTQGGAAPEEGREGRARRDETVGIVGLGLIGGSFAKAYHQAGWRVLAFDVDEDTMARRASRPWTACSTRHGGAVRPGVAVRVPGRGHRVAAP